MKHNFTIKSFSRRTSKGLNPNQANLIETFLPKVTFRKDLNLLKFKDNYKQIILEIGFGNGEFIFSMAMDNPDNLYIGAEPYINGIATLLRKIKDNNINNILIFPDDIRLALTFIPENFFNKIFIICPDPWPKVRHFKRRLIQEQLLIQLAEHLVKEGQIEIFTDHQGYAKWILEHVIKSDKFIVASSKLEKYRKLPSNWLFTKYQKRGLKLGNQIYNFSLTKKDGPIINEILL